MRTFSFFLFLISNIPSIRLRPAESTSFQNPNGLQKEAAQKCSGLEKKERREGREKKTLDATRCRACHPAHYLREWRSFDGFGLFFHALI